MKNVSFWLCAFFILCIMQFGLFFLLSDSRPFFDEGVYLTGSWLFSNGTLPYAGFFESKPLGIFSVGALLFSIFPPSLLAARLLMAFVAVFSSALVFLVSKKIFGEKTAFFACVFFAFLSVAFGNFWFVIEPFVSFLVLLSVFCYLNYLEKKSLAWLSAAILFVIAAVLFKQTAFFLAAFFLLFFIFRETKRQKSFQKAVFVFLKALVPSFVLILAFLAFLLYNGLFSLFFDYLFLFHIENLGYYSGVFLSLDFLPFFVSIAIPFFAAVLLLLKKISFEAGQKEFFALLFLWALGSLAMVLPLMGCCMHFVPVLPALSIVSGFGFFAFWKKAFLLKLFAVFVLLSAVFGGISYAVIFSGSAHGFSDLKNIAGIIQEKSSPNEKILVLPSSPELYFLSARFPATKALYFSFTQYPEYFISEELNSLSAFPPKEVVVFSRDGNFTESSPEIDSFVMENFELRQKIELKAQLYNFYRFALLFEKK
ncbi:MAG TPA: glycosyltransferase family 39 protein [archaeon]|nr:glycosyltransferase family 39 protein [archaeon]